MIEIDINIGDTILTGKFRNKKIIVKDIGTNERGEPTINGKPILQIRIPKLYQEENKMKLKSIILENNVDFLSKYAKKNNIKYNTRKNDYTNIKEVYFTGSLKDFLNQWKNKKLFNLVTSKKWFDKDNLKRMSNKNTDVGIAVKTDNKIFTFLIYRIMK